MVEATSLAGSAAYALAIARSDNVRYRVAYRFAPGLG